jgi:apolipoprotein N-acyltransferase
MKTILRWLSMLWAACPYTQLGKKAFHSVCRDAKPVMPISDRARHLEGQVRIGWAIVLVGFFCPFFWIALFSGARGQTLYFNAIHSGLVILFGIGYLIRGRMALVKERQKHLD